MYVIRNRKSGKILHVAQSHPGEEREASEVYPDFDPETMEFGRSESTSIPAWFDIVDGKVQPLEPPEPRALKGKPPRLYELKETAVAELSRMSVELRQQLIPDYKVQNATLGLYDEERTRAIRDTVAAFREEYHRLEAAVLAADTFKEMEAIRPNFPTELVQPAAEAPDARDSPDAAEDGEDGQDEDGGAA